MPRGTRQAVLHSAAVRSIRAIRAQAKRHEQLLVWLVLALVLALRHGRTIFAHLRLSTDPYVFADDVRILIYPQLRLEDPALFAGDPTVAYYLASLPDGYALLYRTLGPLFGVIALSKGLPYVLFAGTLVCLGATAWRLAGGAAALGTLSLTLGSGYLLARMVGGLPRGFAPLLLAAGALALVLGRARLLAALTFVAASIYPVVALTLGVALTLLLAMPPDSRGCTRRWSLRNRALLLAGTAALSGLVLLPSLLRLRPWGSAIGPSLLAAYPEAGPFGRFDPADRPPFPALPAAALEPLKTAVVGDGPAFFEALSARAHAEWLVPLLAVLACIGFSVLAWRQIEARRFALLPAAIVLCHTLALLVEPRLFLPERYVAYGVPITALLVLPAALGALRSAERAWVRAIPWGLVVTLLVTLGACGVPWSGLSVHVPKEERPLHDAIARLPKSAVIAGFPSETNDSIPYLARRSVLLARETHMPFHTRYAVLMRERARALFQAYFAASRDSLRDIRDRYGVTHLLIDRRHFVNRPVYFAPFDADVARAFDAGKRDGFAVNGVSEEARVAEVGNFALVDLGKL
jgi:hypothetical protein